MRLGSGIGRDNRRRWPSGRRPGEGGRGVLWASELYGFDGVSLMGFLACATETAQIGSSILPSSRRTPTLLP